MAHVLLRRKSPGLKFITEAADDSCFFPSLIGIRMHHMIEGGNKQLSW